VRDILSPCDGLDTSSSCSWQKIASLSSLLSHQSHINHLPWTKMAMVRPTYRNPTHARPSYDRINGPSLSHEPRCTIDNGRADNSPIIIEQKIPSTAASSPMLALTSFHSSNPTPPSPYYPLLPFRSPSSLGTRNSFWGSRFLVQHFNTEYNHQQPSKYYNN